MVIVICDCNDEHRQKLNSYLNVFNKNKKFFQVKEYISGEKLLSDMNNGFKFDVIFLDVESFEGDVAKKIRAAGPDILIIFTASYHDQISYAFEVEAFHYLTKPISFRLFSSTLERAFRRYYEKRKVFKIEWRKQVKSVLLQNIIYIECYNRHILVKTITEVYESCQSFQEVVQKLIPAGFIRVHQSFLVNMAHIKAIEQREITCTGGVNIPVSIRREKEVLEKFKNYLQQFSL